MHNTAKSSAVQEQETRLLFWADQVPENGSRPLIWLHRLVRVLLITLREVRRNSLSLRAGALTYALLLSMVPLLAMSTAVYKGLGGGNQIRDVVYSYIDSLDQASGNDTPPAPVDRAETPPAAGVPQDADLTTHLRSAVDTIFNYVDRTNFATLGTFGMVGIFLSAILVLGQVEKSMNTIWHVEAGRSILRKVADYLTLMVLMPISINVALAAGTLLTSEAMSIHLDRLLPMAWLQSLMLRGVPVLVLSLTLYVVYIFFPNTRVRAIPTLIGALVAGMLWFATQNVYIAMQIGVAKYNAIYGSFATIPLFLVWVWLGWLFVLTGAQLAYAIQNERRYQFIARTATPAEQLSAALDVWAAVSASFHDRQGTDIESIWADCPDYDRKLIESTVRRFVEAGALHHAEETGMIMPSRPPETLTKQYIIATVLGSDPPATPGGKATAQAVGAAAATFPDDQSSGRPQSD